MNAYSIITVIGQHMTSYVTVLWSNRKSRPEYCHIMDGALSPNTSDGRYLGGFCNRSSSRGSLQR